MASHEHAGMPAPAADAPAVPVPQRDPAPRQSPECCVQAADDGWRGAVQVTSPFALMEPGPPVAWLAAPMRPIVETPRGGAPPTSTPRYILLSVFLI
jgi:hypothetical protein